MRKHIKIVSDLEEAFQVADKWIEENHAADEVKFLRKDATWRLPKPTDKQLEYLKTGLNMTICTGTELKQKMPEQQGIFPYSFYVQTRNGVFKLTRGLAAELISRFKMGAKSRSKHVAAEQQRVEKLKGHLDQLMRNTLD